MKKRAIVAALIALVACRREGRIRTGTVSIPTVPRTEVKATVALFIKVDELMKSPLVASLSSPRTHARELKSFLTERIPPCFTDEVPDTVWVVIPEGEGAVVVAAMDPMAVLGCLSRMPGTSRIGNVGIEAGGTVYLRASSRAIVVMPSSLMSVIHPGEGAIGAGRILATDMGATAGLLFTDMKLMDRNMIRLLGAIPHGEERMASWFKAHPTVSGALLLYAEDRLRIVVALDLGDGEAALSMARSMTQWLKTRGREGRVTVDHGAVSMEFTMSAQEVDAMLSTFLASLRAARKRP